ncbi:MAG TPA: hypothetical protein VGG27_09905 [Magnetospirillaceae bacterium]|jgi:hypothetical protein
MQNYRVNFVDKDSVVLLAQDFEAQTDVSAVLVADWLFDACSEVYSGYELWCGARRFIPLAHMGVSWTSLALSASEDSMRAVQQIVADRERTILESGEVIARSRRLLRATARLETTLATREAS